MMKRLLQPALCLVICPLLVAQQVVTPGMRADAPQNSLPDPHGNSSSRTVRIPKDTLVVLRLEQRLSTADAKQGDKVHFTLANDLAAGGQVLVPAGTSCDLTITGVWRATPENPYQTAGIQFSDPELDLGHGQMVRLTTLSYAMRHDGSDGVTDRDAFFLMITSPFWLPPVLIQEANAKRAEVKANRAVVTPKNWKPYDAVYEEGHRDNYYFRRAVKIRTDRLPTSSSSTHVQ